MNIFRSSIISAIGAALALVAPVSATAADYTFQTLNNGTDPTFNQLLGINNAGTIAGYFGSGSAAHPNKGYTLAPPIRKPPTPMKTFLTRFRPRS